MRTSIGHDNRITADAYAKPLLSLDEEVRVEIMHILLNSISGKAMNPKKNNYDLYTCFGGTWGDGLTAEDYCKELRDGLSEPKDIETW